MAQWTVVVVVADGSVDGASRLRGLWRPNHPFHITYELSEVDRHAALAGLLRDVEQ